VTHDECYTAHNCQSHEGDAPTLLTLLLLQLAPGRQRGNPSVFKKTPLVEQQEFKEDWIDFWGAVTEEGLAGRLGGLCYHGEALRC